MTKIFMEGSRGGLGGAGGGGVAVKGSERCLKWGGGVIKGSFQKISKQVVDKGKSCS